MDYRALGRTGVEVSPLCLGAMMFGAWGNPDHEDSVRIIHAALDAGVNFVDTADVYSAGESEEIVGKALAGRRDQVVLATKFHGSMGEESGISLIHLAIAFVIRHPAVTAAIIGPRTMEQLESQLGATEVELSEDVLDRIDEIVAPGTNFGPADAGWSNPDLEPAARRQRAPARGARAF
jgi:aryl-alcohol dehydrogenase-like predicted oxidoreductase